MSGSTPADRTPVDLEDKSQDAAAPESTDRPDQKGTRGRLRSLATRVVGQLPAGRAARVFLMVTFVDAAGRGLFLAGSALFYTQIIGLTNTQVGVGISLAGLFGLICAVPIGRLADRIGEARTLILLQIWRAIGFLVYPLVSDFRMFLVIACFIGAAEWAVGPIIQSVAGTIAAEDSYVGTMAMVTVVRNVGYALSALVATAVITSGSSSAYIGLVLGNAAAFLLTAIQLIRLKLPRSASREEAKESAGVRHLPLRDVPFLSLTLANGILYLHATLLSVALPLWIITRTHAPKSLVGVALIINTLMAVTLQMRLSKGGDDIGVAARKQFYAGMALAGCCALVAVTGSLGAVTVTFVLLIAMAALTLGEIWQSAGAWGLSYGLSPASRLNYFLSIYGLGATGMTVVGPGLLAASVLDEGAAGWLCLAGVFAATGLAVPAIARVAARRVPA